MTQFLKCFSTLGAPDLSWEQTLDFAQKHQFQGVELRCLAGTVISPENLEELLPSPTDFSEALESRGLGFPMLGTSAKLLQRTEGELEDLQRHAEFADQTGCPWLRIFDGGRAAVPLSQETLAQTADFLTNWETLRRREGIHCQLAVETHDAFASLTRLQEAMAALPDFKVLWDTHHTWRFGESLETYHAAVAPRTVHFHLKDSVNRPSKRKPFTYVEPGTGEFPWTQLRDILQSPPPGGFLSFEWEKHWNPELAEIQDVADAFHHMTENW